MGDKAQKAHIRAVKHFAGFLKRSPDTATPDDLRAYQLHMALSLSYAWPRARGSGDRPLGRKARRR
jgi:hypothetical protein